MHTISNKRLLMLRPDEIENSEYSLRHEIDSYELKLLADSIYSVGIIEPLPVRKTENGKYRLISGKRRLKAAGIAGLRRVPCVLHKIDEATAVLYAVTENLQRSGLDFFEEAECFELLITSYGMSQTELAAKLGLLRCDLADSLKLLRLGSDIRESIRLSGLTRSQAMDLLKLPFEKRRSALDYIIVKNMNERESAQYIENCLNPKNNRNDEKIEEKPFRKSSIGDMRLFSNSLSKLIDTLKNSGINVNSRKYENEKYIEYRVKIKKEVNDNYKAEQLKIC